MKKFKFEISNTVEIDIISKTKEDARQVLVENPDLYKDELSDNSCYISNGIEVEYNDN